MKAARAIVAVVAVVVAAYVVYHFHQRNQISRLNNEAVALLNQGQYEQARVRLEQASAKAPDNPSIWKNLGVCYEEMNENAKAVEAFKRSLALNPDQPDVSGKVEELEALLKARQNAPK